MNGDIFGIDRTGIINGKRAYTQRRSHILLHGDRNTGTDRLRAFTRNFCEIECIAAEGDTCGQCSLDYDGRTFTSRDINGIFCQFKHLAAAAYKYRINSIDILLTAIVDSRSRDAVKIARAHRSLEFKVSDVD